MNENDTQELQQQSTNPNVNDKLGDRTFRKKKRMLKFLFSILLSAIVVSNAIFAWAIPDSVVECCKDSVFDYFNETFAVFDKYKGNLYILIVLFLSSDLIFYKTLHEFVLTRGRLKFSAKMILVILIKLIFDYLFYQKNIYFDDRLNKMDKLLNFSITHNLGKNDSSLFSISFALTFLCYSEWSKERKNYPYYAFIGLQLILASIYYLLSNMVFAYQLFFSFLLVDYMNKLLSILKLSDI